MNWHDLSLPLFELLQIIFINLVLSADNVVVIGLAASALQKPQRSQAIFWGIAAATILRIIFALIANYLLGIVGLALAGGILLLWVCWKFWRELEHQRRLRKIRRAEEDGLIDPQEAELVASGESPIPGRRPSEKMRDALIQIIVADVSMSLDNVLGVAGAAHGNTTLLILGLLLSVLFMGFAAKLFASLLEKYPLIAYAGLAVILYVALELIFQGSGQILELWARR